MDLDGVETGVDGEPGGRGVGGDDVIDVVAVGVLGELIASGLKNRTGARAWALFEREFATGPAWPICALIAAPSAWMASASRCRPGTAWAHPDLAAVGPAALLTAQYATVVMPTPPAASPGGS